MPSTFTGIEIGKRSLQGHATGLNTVGHNLGNASVDGYSRQRVEMRASDAIYLPGLSREERPGQLGQGMEVARVTRARDSLLEGRIVKEQNLAGYWSDRDKYLLMVDQVYLEPTDASVRARMDAFWQAWEELSLRPSEVAPRQAVVERGKALIDAIHNRSTRLHGIRDMVDDDLRATIVQVNGMAREIGDLNRKIVKVEAMGDLPNDLYDRRDLLVGKLSGLIDVEVSGRDPDEFMIHTGGSYLVQGHLAREVTARSDPNNEGYARLEWPEGSAAVFRGGRVAALAELRDLDVRGEIQKIDLATINFIDLVNEVHRSGVGLDRQGGVDFFVEYPFINNLAGNYDRSGDGVYDSSYVFRMTGRNRLEHKDQIGLQGTMTFAGASGDVRVDYFPTDTVEDLMARINLSGAEVAARLNQKGELTLKATDAADTANPDFVVRHVEDSGQFLVGYAGLLRGTGPEGAFDWRGPDAVLAMAGGSDYAVAPLAHPAAWVAVNPVLDATPERVASGFEGFGDGSTALAIARLRTDQVMIGRIPTFDDFFAQTAAEIGLKGETAARSLETIELVMKQLGDMRQSLSGVNMDEELADMIKFQHGYNAAARFVTQVDQMIDTIINRMGV